MKMTKYGDYATWIKFPVFANYSIRTIFTDNLVHSAKARLVRTPQEGADAFCYHDHQGITWMFFGLYPSNAIIAHEAWHAIREMLDYVGAGLDNEVVAYHLSFLVEEIEKFKSKLPEVKPQRKSKRKR